MQFIVHVDYELSHVPHAYHNGRPGMTTIVEPGKVDWQLMEKNLRCQGYKGKADLYYIKPGCVPPEGMVQISGQHDVDEMLHALEGLKKCHLYIVKNCAFSDDAQFSYDSDDDMYEQVGYIAKFLLIIQKMATSFACWSKYLSYAFGQDMSEEDIYSCGYMDISERNMGEYIWVIAQKEETCR